MTLQELEWIIRIACFVLGISLASIVYELMAARHLESISKSLNRFVAWAEKKDGK